MMISGVFVPQVILLALAGLLGASIPVLLGRFVLSQKDRNDNDQKRYENSRQLLADSATNANALQAALGKSLKKAKPGVDDVVTIMNAGAAYFANLQSMAQAILDGRVSESTRTQSLVPRIVEAMEKSLPAYYDALTRLSAKVGIPFAGEFSEENYAELFQVADQYDRAGWLRIRHKMAQVKS